jgi:hypothetical protein
MCHDETQINVIAKINISPFESLSFVAETSDDKTKRGKKTCIVIQTLYYNTCNLGNDHEK